MINMRKQIAMGKPLNQASASQVSSGAMPRPTKAVVPASATITPVPKTKGKV